MINGAETSRIFKQCQYSGAWQSDGINVVKGLNYEHCWIFIFHLRLQWGPYPILTQLIIKKTLSELHILLCLQPLQKSGSNSLLLKLRLCFTSYTFGVRWRVGTWLRGTRATYDITKGCISISARYKPILQLKKNVVKVKLGTMGPSARTWREWQYWWYISANLFSAAANSSMRWNSPTDLSLFVPGVQYILGWGWYNCLPKHYHNF